MIRYGHVMQWFEDGNVMVIGHGIKKIKLSDSQENEKRKITEKNTIKLYLIIQSLKNGFIF